MNTLTSALWDAFSFVADKLDRAANSAAFFMEECLTKIRYLFIFDTTDPYTKLLRLAEESQKRMEQNRKNNL